MKKFIPLFVLISLFIGALHNATGCAIALSATNIADKVHNNLQTVSGNENAETIVIRETTAPNNCDLDDAENEILNFYAEKKGIKSAQCRISSVDKKIESDYAYNYGYYELSHSIKGQSNNIQKMAYLILWKRVSSQKWKMYLDVWNYQGTNQQDVYFF